MGYLESVAVEPYCSIDQDGIRVWTLLAVQQKDGSYRVWAYICWEWPTGELVNSGDIYSVLDEKNLNVTSDELFSEKGRRSRSVARFKYGKKKFCFFFGP